MFRLFKCMNENKICVYKKEHIFRNKINYDCTLNTYSYHIPIFNLITIYTKKFNGFKSIKIQSFPFFSY